MIWARCSFFKCFYSFSIYCQPVKSIQLTINLQKIMIFWVFNDEIQWTLDFGPDSVTIIVKDLNRNITVSSQEIPLAVWLFLFSQRQHFMDNTLPRVPINQNQEGKMEMNDDILSSVGAQDLETSSSEVSNLKDIEFNWENSQLGMDAMFRSDIDTPFSPKRRRFFDWGFSWKTHCVGRRRRQGEFSSSSINTRVYQTYGTSQTEEKLSIWKKNRKCSQSHSKKFLSISITVFLF